MTTMTTNEYFTFDVTHKYINRRKTQYINYTEGFYISGIADNFKRYSLKKINRDIFNLNSSESQSVNHHQYKPILTTDIPKKKKWIKN